MVRFTREVSVSFNLLASPSRLDRGRSLPSGVEPVAAHAGWSQTNPLGRSDGRRDVFPGKKGGAEVGLTKRGKGVKIMLMVDAAGTPLSAFTCGANVAEVSAIETLVDLSITGRVPDRLLDDKAADADWLRDHLNDRSVELICPHRRNRQRAGRQDGRALRRYWKRFVVERTISWLQNCRRLLIRWEYYDHLFEGFLKLGCLFTILKWF